jgi:hypothetical protein
MPAEIAAAPVRPADDSDNSATRVDIALLVSILFMQRFSLPFGTKVLHLNFVAMGIILLYQFARGNLLIQFNRLSWFLPFSLASTCSLVLNTNSASLTAYFQLLIMFLLFTFIRPSTEDQYNRTLRACQFLLMTLSCIGVVQFFAQFVVNGEKLIMFYGLVPDILLGGEFGSRGFGTIRGMVGGLIKSNGIFLVEPSIFSQAIALGILIEALEFRRPRYLIIMTLGFLVGYSGTGLILLLVFLPLAGLRNDRVMSHALLIVIFAIGLFATGIIQLSAFTSRVGEFGAYGSSGFLRFVMPFYVAAAQFDMEALQPLLLGGGPGATHAVVQTPYGWANTDLIWVKILREYGIIGSFTFWYCLASCFRRSRCSGLVSAAIVFSFVFLGGMIETAIPLCALNGTERRRLIDLTCQY